MAITRSGDHPTASPPPPMQNSSSSDAHLVRSLLRISRDIAASEIPAGSLHRRNIASTVRKSKLLSIMFEDLLLRLSGGGAFPRPVKLCFKEVLVILQRLKVLIADCSTRSRTRLLLQCESVSNAFHELTHDLSTLLDILPLPDLDVGNDVRELVALLRRQCRRSDAVAAADRADPEAALRREVLDVIREIEREVVPDRAALERIFFQMGLVDAGICRDEIDRLDREIGDRAAEAWASSMVAIAGLVRYGKCVLFGSSSAPRTDLSSVAAAAAAGEVAVPGDFRCPISLELMRDPVVVATGQTYDRESIGRWIAAGHATCPKTGQALSHANLVPNRALRNLISRWCREQNVAFDAAAEPGDVDITGAAAAATTNKAALEAARMTAAFLVERLAATSPPPSTESTNRVVHELRLLSKTGAENRALVAEAGAIPLLLPPLLSGEADLQLNAITALLNLSVLEANKKRIMHAAGCIDGVVHVIASGATAQARGNAAATLLSLCSNHSYRRRLGRSPRVVGELVALVESGPAAARKDALAAVLGLAAERENIPRLLEEGVAEMALAAMEDPDAAEAAVAVLAALAKRGGAEALVDGRGSVVAKLVGVLSRGSDRARESAAAALLLLCRKSGTAAVAELAATPGIEWVICELMSSGTERARRKATSLGRICRKWVAADEAYQFPASARFGSVNLAVAAAAAAADGGIGSH